MRHQGNGFFYDGDDEPDNELGAFVWGVLFGVLGGLFVLGILGIEWWR